MRSVVYRLTVLFFLVTALTVPALAGTTAAVDSTSPLIYINTAFENASPLFWEIEEDGTVVVHLVYDHERASPNRANGHWHFQVQAEPGSTLRLAVANFFNIYNGRSSNPVRGDHPRMVVSEDGKHWRSVPAVVDDERRVVVELEMTAPTLYVASVEPYRLSDLQTLLDDIRGHPRVAISPLGRTVEGRPLERVQVGREEASYRILIRARAHPWEPGGNWVVEGLIRSLLRDEADNARYLDRYTLDILPMANKDGVARGRTRFNALGVDLNRGWDTPADPALAPENAALEDWLQTMINVGNKPDLAIELHNDKEGQLHLSPSPSDTSSYPAHMQRLESLLRAHTWFTEGSRTSNTLGTMGAGLVHRYGIDAFVYELNADWIAGLNKPASADDWKTLGEQLRVVFYEYFEDE